MRCNSFIIVKMKFSVCCENDQAMSILMKPYTDMPRMCVLKIYKF